MAIKYLNELKIRQVDSEGTPEIHQLKLRSGALDVANIMSNIAVDWSEVTGKPTTFAPSTHSHAWSEVTGKPSTFAPSTHTHAWSEVTGKPTTFEPSTHSHAWSTITSRPADNQFPNTAQAIGGSQNLNSYTTPGFYYQSANASAANGSNYPVARAGTLIVTKDAGTTQMYYDYNGGGIYYRTLYGSTWTAWKDILTPAWSSVSGKPTTATRWPTWSEVTSKPTTATRWPTWSEVTSKPSSSTTTILSLRTVAADTTYTLSQSIANFDMIIAYAIVYYSSSTAYNVIPVIFTPSADQTPGGAVYTASYQLGSNTTRSMTFFFPTATTVKISSTSGSSGPRLYIQGTKFGL